MKRKFSILNNYIHSPKLDLTFVLLPSFVVVLLLFLVHFLDVMPDEVNDWTWALLVLGVDVSHVYSTLYRTYWNPEKRKEYPVLLWLAPVVCLGLGIFCYALSAGIFWRTMAYLAVFHFIRQQYGFMRLYSRGLFQSLMERTIDTFTLYMLTLHPMVYWHTHPLSIQWFTQHDFFQFPNWMYYVSSCLYAISILVYAVKEFRVWNSSGVFNLNKNLILIGTGLSWYLGIIYFQEDFAFTALNVLSHGIPYMALVWAYTKKETGHNGNTTFRHTRNVLGIMVFVVSLLLLAYLEEYWWDALVWQEHSLLFPFSTYWKNFDFSSTFVWLVPLLSLPQITHYVLDGFIWKSKRSN